MPQLFEAETPNAPANTLRSPPHLHTKPRPSFLASTRPQPVSSLVQLQSILQTAAKGTFLKHVADLSLPALQTAVEPQYDQNKLQAHHPGPQDPTPAALPSRCSVGSFPLQGCAQLSPWSLLGGACSITPSKGSLEYLM